MIHVPNTRRRRLALTLVGLLAATAWLSACGDDDATSTTTAPPATPAPSTTTPPAPETPVLHVSLSDFSFGELPDEVPVGTRLAVENVAVSELHELVAVRLPDGDQRPVDDIVANGLPELFQAGPPAVVMLVPPGGEAIVPVGDPTLTEPGRYLLVCMIPTGVDIDAFMEALAEGGEGPPDVPGGPPHVAHGMFGELTVTAGA